MKKLFITILSIACSLEISAQRDRQQSVLWYDSPAAHWVEALPLGNGRLGAMVYGGLQSDTIQLNEDHSGAVRHTTIQTRRRWECWRRYARLSTTATTRRRSVCLCITSQLTRA